MQRKLTKVHFITRELVLASVAAFIKTPALSPNLAISGLRLDELGPLIISDEVKAIWLVETRNLKWYKR